MSLEGKRIAVLAEDIYEDLELWYPLLRLREEGAEVVVVGSGSKDRYESKHGYPVDVDATADEVSADDFDGVVVPGGYAPDKMRRYPAVVDFVREIDAQGKLVAAICHAGWVPISADIVSGRTVTGVSAIKDDLVNAGATFVDEAVVVDGNIVTSRTPKDLPAFLPAIIESLQ